MRPEKNVRITPLRLESAIEPFGAPSRPSGPPLAPLLAGARARGVADGLEWLGLAAVLLDDRGEVLHVNSGAVELMGEDLFLQDGLLRARNLATDAALRGAIREAVERASTTRLTIARHAGEETLSARIAAIETLDDDPFQLLRVVAILERSGGEAGAKRH